MAFPLCAFLDPLGQQLLLLPGELFLVVMGRHLLLGGRVVDAVVQFASIRITGNNGWSLALGEHAFPGIQPEFCLSRVLVRSVTREAFV